MILSNRTIILGITGSIAAYKAAELASHLVQLGANVNTIMTESAEHFISPLTLRSLTGRPVATGMFELNSEFVIEHVSLAEAADIVVIAPATANIIAKLSAGLADDILSSTVLATRSPIIIAPAMNVNMNENQVTQSNLSKLVSLGFIQVGPVKGRLASGEMGLGRFASIGDITGAICRTLGENGDLARKHLVITAGGTQEPIDPVRNISNRSSGKMGYALAEAARDRGARVTLIAAPSALIEPYGVELYNVNTAMEMYSVVSDIAPRSDALIMAAAVADYRPANAVQAKIKKADTPLTLDLVNNPDILDNVKGSFVRVGFAAESEHLVENARAKLQRKKLDLIVANDITIAGSGFGAENNEVVLIGRGGVERKLPLLPKRDVADKILDEVASLLR